MIATWFKDVLHRGFDIREGEMRRALLMQANIFLIITTLLVVKSSANGLFLTDIGVEYLPIGYILVAIVAGFVTTAYTRQLDRTTLNRIIQRTIISSVVLLVVFGVLIYQSVLTDIVLFVYYVWVAIFALLATSQFWVLANLVFNPREAKRLFGFIGSGAVAGGIFGGYLTSLLAPILSTPALLLISAVILLPCIPLSRIIWKEFIEGVQPVFQRKQRLPVQGNSFSIIRGSKHLTYLAMIVGVSVLVAKLVDYQFARIASALIPDEDSLTAFLGFWFSTFNVISLMLQLFLTRRVVGTLGVGTSLFFLPLLVLLAAITLLVFPELLAAAVILKMSDGSLKQSINKAALELIILPIPVMVKSRAKTFIDVFVDSLATGVCGLILIFIVRGLNLSTNVITALIIVFVGVWLFYARRIKSEYLLSLKRKVTGDKNDQESESGFDLDSSTAIAGLKNVMKQGKPGQIIYVLTKIREFRNEQFFEEVRALMRHHDAEVRAQAIHTLTLFRHVIPDKEMEVLTRDASQEVKIRAFEYLLERSGGDIVGLMDRYLKDLDYRVRSAALISLAIETRDNPQLKEKFQLVQRLDTRYGQLSFIENAEERQFRAITLLKALGHAAIPSKAALIVSFVEDRDPEVVDAAINAMALSLQQAFIPHLLGFLKSQDHRQAAIDALVLYGYALNQYVVSPGIPYLDDPEVRRIVPRVLARINHQSSVNTLFALNEDKDRGVRQGALNALVEMRRAFPTLKFDRKEVIRNIFNEARLYQDTLSAIHTQHRYHQLQETPSAEKQKVVEARESLITLLSRRLDQNLQRIFKLLGLRYPESDMSKVYEGIRSSEDETSNNALEFLDNLLDPGLKRVLIPLIETAMIETISEEAVKRLNLRIPSEPECFELLLQRNDVRVKLAVLYLIARIRNADYTRLATSCLQDTDENVRAYATRVLKEISEEQAD